MLPQLSAAVRVFLCTRPTDLRKELTEKMTATGMFHAVVAYGLSP